MEEIEIRELGRRASELMRHVREDGASYAITHRGRVIGHLKPDQLVERPALPATFWDEWERLAEEISRQVEPGTDALEAVLEQRRDL